MLHAKYQPNEPSGSEEDDWLVGWLVGFGLNGPLRQYFSLYWTISQRQSGRKKREMIEREKCPNQH